MTYALKVFEVKGLERFDIDLKGMAVDELHYSYNLDNEFFSDVESKEVSGGDVKAEVNIRKRSHSFDVTIDVDGTVVVACDRCLDDMELHVDASDRLVVKWGDKDNYEDEIIEISEAKGILNVGWLIYESICLAIPMTHVHEEGQCNEEMADKLSRLMTYEAGDVEVSEEDGEEEDKPIDPRWEELKKILDNN